MKVEVSQSCPTLSHPMDYTVHGIFYARILQWVPFPFTRGSFSTQGLNPLQADSLPAEPHYLYCKSKISSGYIHRRIKIRIYLYYQPKFHFWVYIQKNWNEDLEEISNCHGYCNGLYHSQDIYNLNVYRQVNKENMIYTYDRILFS